jgi:dTDP-glucose pyrophosphorylase
MRTTALIMAGGAGQRMRVSGGPRSKPLAPVRGVPLVERNLLALLGSGFRDVKVAVPLGHADLGRWLDERGEPLAAAVGARLERIEERRPLGSMGAAALLRGACETLLVVFADNLTSLDLRALVSRHEETGPALTIATHDQRFQLPYGVPRVDGDRVLAFEEKPATRLLVSSGLYVLGPTALAVLEAGETVGAPILLARLLARDPPAPVLRFQHAAPWIDVNDAQALSRAEQLAAEQPSLECWAPRVDRERATVLLGREGRWLVERTEAGGVGLWELPGVPLAPGADPAEALRAAHIVEPQAKLSKSATFDDVDLATGEIVRHHLLRASGDREAAPEGARWIGPVAAEQAASLRWSTQRSLAYAGSLRPDGAAWRQASQTERFAG